MATRASPAGHTAARRAATAIAMTRMAPTLTAGSSARGVSISAQATKLADATAQATR